MEDVKRRMQENDLLKRESSLRRSRVGAFVLAVLFLVATPPFLDKPPKDGSSRQERTEQMLGMVVLVAALGYQYHLQIRHIESIKMYRRKLSDLETIVVDEKTE